jgi:multimeric flavodoxin WrbA
MKVLVINASANKERSTTLKLTKAFLEGLGEKADFITTIDMQIKPCRACYACWFKTKGKCVQKDDATMIIDKIQEADLVIWSIPLYAYGVPSHCKALMDRTVSLNSPMMYVDNNGIAHHHGYEEGTKKTVLISTAGLPNIKGNFDGLLFQMRHMYGNDITAICCAEGSLFMSPNTQDIVTPYIEKVKQAGQEYKEKGRISNELQQYLDTLLLPTEAFVNTMNGIFDKLMS